MATLPQIIVIDEEPVARELLRATLAESKVEVIAETDSLVYGYELIRHNRPQMVFIDLRNDSQKTLETIRRISTYFKDVMVVVSGTTMNLDIVKACMEAGVRDFLERPLQSAEIKAVVEKHRMAMLAGSQGDQSGRLITVFSNKGGLGKTTIAVNLAVALSEVVGKPVALVDLNLQLGDIVTFLNVEPKQTIVDLSRNIGLVDAAYLETSLAEFSVNNASVFVLADPLQVEDAEDLTAEQINAVLTVLRATFEYVVIDTTTSFDSKTLTALDLADHILLVSMINLPSVRSSQRLLSLFERLGYDKQKIKLVINRYLPDEEITPADVEDVLSHPIFWKIPNNYPVVMKSINTGVPLAAVDGGKHLDKNFRELAHKISGVLSRGGSAVPVVNPGSEPNKGLLSNLFGKR